MLPEDYCKKDPCNFNTEMFVSKVGQPMSNSWSTSSQPDFVRALGRTRTVGNHQGKILYTELLKRWSTSLSIPRPLPTPVAGVFTCNQVLLARDPYHEQNVEQMSRKYPKLSEAAAKTNC